MTFTKKIFFLGLIASASIPAFGQIYNPTDNYFNNLDSSFGTNGIANIDIGNHRNYAGMALQKDNKIVILGSSGNSGNRNFVVARLNADGTADNTFGSSGISRISFGGSRDTAAAIALQSDGKIIIGGQSNTAVGSNTHSKWVIARLNTNGTLDNTFGTAGKVIFDTDTTDVNLTSLICFSDNRIIAAGNRFLQFDIYTNTNWYYPALTCLKPDGKVDSSFGFNADGTVNIMTGVDTRFAALVPMKNDSFVAVYNNLHDQAGAFDDFSGYKFASNGIAYVTYDLGYLETNRTYHTMATAAAIQPGGELLVAGYAHVYVNSTTESKLSFLCRFKADGSADKYGFGPSNNWNGYNQLSGSMSMPTGVTMMDDSLMILSGYDIISGGGGRPFRFNEIKGRDYSDDRGPFSSAINTDGISQGLSLQGKDKLLVAGSGAIFTNSFWYYLTVVRYKHGNRSTAVSNVSGNYNALEVYPNPVNGDQTMLRFTNEMANKVTITVNSMDGKVLKTVYNQYMKEGEQNLMLDLSGLANGIYTVHLVNENGAKSFSKIVKL